MAIELANVLVKHERRVRLVFSAPLGAGAYGTPAPAAYVLENEDGRGPSPGVSAAIFVVGATTNVELALDADLAPGALYHLTAIGIPAADASVSTTASDLRFRFGSPTTTTNVEPKVSDAELLLFGRDLVHSGVDYVETAEGDLAVAGGLQNAQAALQRRILGSPLPWAPGYSPRAREFVDAPLPYVGALRSRIEKQALLDDRVQSVTASMQVDETDAYFEVRPIFKGAIAAQSFNVPVVAPTT